jgi:DNA-binding transcriptional LysR family regulator
MEPVPDMRAYIQVIECGSFCAAADKLECTPSAVSKLVSRLEDRLGVRLLHRTTRRLAMTPEGETYYQRARDILAAIEDAESEVSRAGINPRGRLRVNCGTGVGLYALAPVLPDFLARYPQVDVELAITDRVIDLIAENADVAIRTGPVTDPWLVARRITDVERGIFASPAYLARRGTPRTRIDFREHDCIIVSGGLGLQRWPFRDGKAVRFLEVAGRVVVDDAGAALRLAIAGAGLIRVSDLHSGPAVREGQLVPVAVDDHFVEPVPMSAIYPQGRHRMAKVRAFVDFLVERLSHAPWRAGLARRAARAKTRS